MSRRKVAPQEPEQGSWLPKSHGGIGSPGGRAGEAPAKGWGEIGLRGRGVVGAPFSDPPLLSSRDGALKKVIDGGK